MNEKLNRRNFLGKAALGAAAVTIIPRHVMGGKGFVAANDRINLGFIGTGKQGGILLNYFADNCKDLVPVAACDVYKTKLDRFVEQAKTSLAKNGHATARMQAYEEYRDLLANPDVDAVVIATPDHWHAQMAVDAAKAGKDIYCEKPMALTVAEGRAMVEATRKYKRVFQTGNMQRSWRNFRHAVELVRNGYIGEIKEINVSVGDPVIQCNLPSQKAPEALNWDLWVGPSLYRDFHAELAPPVEVDVYPNWRNYRNFGGGMVTDWGAHMFDIAQWAMGMDESGPVEFIPPEKPAKRGLKMVYENGVVVNHVDWGDFNAVQFIGTEGKVEISRSFLRTFPIAKLAEQALKETDERVYYSDNHYQDWVKAMRTREKPISDVETGHRTASMCNLANISYELQRPLSWDPKKEEFKNDQFANLMRTRPFRGQWDFTDF
ncbi:Gfo/Idh/MocA family oxidoreductase [uncultured Sunxiuqinia sp.]|uniref:Gfo/Idh/MocA family protein n=1 Tax=uncultured Sunxiuqinia sp. TaxID=1573825 RepID=UPI00261CDB5F|nr:Gfo/Idh/MocA family oxidoreductase [uncultured Sunxiuqinia sp.]